jgi:hypothetical protein
MKLLKEELGNVVLETVFAILIFGGVLIPAAVSLMQIASLHQQLQDTAFAVARAWSKTEASAQLRVVNEMSDWYKKQRGIDITYKCVPGCGDSKSVIKVVAKQSTGVAFLPKLSKSVELERSFYAE